MLRSYPRLLIGVNSVTGEDLGLWDLTSYSGSGTATYALRDTIIRAKLRGRYPKEWRKTLLIKGFREPTVAEDLFYAKT